MSDEGDKRETTEELFEDLDKFFAPIKDVDWPETEEEEPALPPATAAGEGHVEVQPPAEPEPEPIRLEEPAFEEPAVEPEPAAEPEPEPAPEPEPEVEREEPSFEEEAEVEGPSRFEEPPSDEAVEAAVEHFAGSLREEVEEGVEDEVESETYPTAEMPAMDVFGEEERSEIEREEVEEGILADVEPPPLPQTIKVGAEGLGGPSWQEPTSLEVGTELERRPGERDVPAAFVTGLILAVLAVGSLLISTGAFAFVASILVLLGQGELYGVLHRRHRQPATAIGLVTGGLILAAAYLRGEAAMLSMAALGTVATFLWYMAVPASHRKDVAGNIALTVLPVVYGPLLAGYALTTLALEDVDGRALVLAVIGLTFVYDTAAFVVGYFWGNRPLAPTVSPKKSWEGVVGATLVVVAVSVAFVASWVVPLEQVERAVGLALVVAVFAPLGDLAESLLKRDLGVKDMGSILPGHGGVLDRIDSVLFVAPAALVFFRLVL